MIDRYLDDETYKAYVDALERAAGRAWVPRRRPRPRKPPLALPRRRLQQPRRRSAKAADSKTAPPGNGAGQPRAAGQAAPPPAAVPF